MDKTWIKAPRTSIEYKNGVAAFMELACRGHRGKDDNPEILCPCNKCCNVKWLRSNIVEEHIFFNGFLPGYTSWVCHGERESSSKYDSTYMRKMLSMCNDAQSSNPLISSQPSCAQSYIDSDNIRCLLEDVMRSNFLNSEGGQPNVIEGVVDILESMGGHASSSDFGNQPSESPESESIQFKKLIEECDQELYPGCTYSKLAFNLHLYHLKCMGGISNNIFSMLLKLLKDVFPFLTSLPSSAQEAKNYTNALGLGYEKIHACPNDCILYWGEKVSLEQCDVCHTSRWQVVDKDKSSQPSEMCSSNKKKKPVKVLRYFHLIPRLKRLYASSKTAKYMRWHYTSFSEDGKLIHPVDGLAWKTFNARYPEFASDPRSVRLGLASDGFNPFRMLNSTYSTWPVVLIPYNLPPWKCMKQNSFLLSMIIPGEKGPGNKIDVYLQPLIHELQQLWKGVDAYDAYSKENFILRVALMWTINDFPAYANLSGWSTKGRVACPICVDSTYSIWLKHSRKFSYMGHRRWLQHNHPYRFLKDLHDGTIEKGIAPSPLSGIDVLGQLEGTSFTQSRASKYSRKRTRDDVARSNKVPTWKVDNSTSANVAFGPFKDVDDFIDEDIDRDQHLWKKKSIFFYLPCWKFNLLRHNLDVMHMEKNVCDNLLRTFLNLDGKTKDNEKARKDLLELNIRHDLHPIERPNKRLYLPPTYYTMSASEKSTFLKVLHDLKVPDGYASNISWGVNLNDRKISNLKSHDGDILIQDIMPIALRASMHVYSQKRVVEVVSELCYFFKGICAKVFDPQELVKLEHRLIVTLCHLEQIFLPSFFTIMVHLTIHLVSEATLGGPVFYRWMYPIERFLVRLKSYVRNRANPEGSMAEGYIADECLTFCSRYFEGVETVFNRPQRNDDNILYKEKYILHMAGRALGKVESVELDQIPLAQAHRYVLMNNQKIRPYINKFYQEKSREHHGRITYRLEQKWLVEEFSEWLQKQVLEMDKDNCDEEIIALSRGPNTFVNRFKAFVSNSYKFHTREREKFRRTQNSGVRVEANGKTYYGVINEIYELDYFGRCKVVLFRCDWADTSNRGMKRDKYGLPLVSFSSLIHTGKILKDDPFILSSDAKQVFYVEDQKDKGWFHVIVTKPRDIYDMGENIEGIDDESYTQCLASNAPVDLNLNSIIGWRRIDIIEEDNEA